VDFQGITDYLAARHQQARGQKLTLPWRARVARLRQEVRALPVRALSWATASHQVVITVPRFQGAFEVDVRGTLLSRLLTDTFERHLARLAFNVIEPEDDVIDVGANIGLFSVLCAQRAHRARVLAIEPAPHAIDLLRRNVARNHCSNVIIYAGAAIDHSDGARLRFSPGCEEYASLGGFHHPHAPTDHRTEIQVGSTTLDELVRREQFLPRFLKIDVEGAEGAVLRGAREILRTARPIILSELDDRLLRPQGDDSHAIQDSLLDLGYAIFDAHSGSRMIGGKRSGTFIGEILAIPED
jgi:FkbM family methyltransferase